MFEKSGIEYLIECPFVPQVMTMAADAFVRWIVKSLNVKCIIVGDDFRFGHNREGAVSYTHLDVYKRQIEYFLCWA